MARQNKYVCDIRKAVIEMEKCSNCDGIGRIELEYADDYDTEEHYEDCPICNGNGYVGTREGE